MNVRELQRVLKLMLENEIVTPDQEIDMGWSSNVNRGSIGHVVLYDDKSTAGHRSGKTVLSFVEDSVDIDYELKYENYDPIFSYTQRVEDLDG